MTLLDKLMSWLGLDSSDHDDETAREVGVTVERSDRTPSPETEAAVKGTDDQKFESESESETSPEAETPSETESETDVTSETEAEQPSGQPAAETEPSEEAETAEETEGEEAEDEAEPEETADVTDIKGIGPAYADRLGDAGIDSVAALAEADADELADATDISATRIQNWIDQAKVR